MRHDIDISMMQRVATQADTWGDNKQPKAGRHMTCIPDQLTGKSCNCARSHDSDGPEHTL